MGGETIGAWGLWKTAVAPSASSDLTISIFVDDNQRGISEHTIV